MHQYIHRRNITRNLLGRHEPGKNKMFAQTNLGCPSLKPPTVNTVSDQQKLYAWHFSDDARSRLEQKLVPFQPKQPRDLADNEIALRDSQRLAKRVIVRSVKKSLDIHSAVDRNVFARHSNSCREVPLRHRV